MRSFKNTSSRLLGRFGGYQCDLASDCYCYYTDFHIVIIIIMVMYWKTSITVLFLNVSIYSDEKVALSSAKYKKHIITKNTFGSRWVHRALPLLGLMKPRDWEWRLSQDIIYAGGWPSPSPPWCKPVVRPRSPLGTVGIRCTALPWCSPGSTYQWPCCRGGPESLPEIGRTGFGCMCTLWCKGRETLPQRFLQMPLGYLI